MDDETKLQCMGCGVWQHHSLIDAKPPPGEDPETANYTVLNCRPCYGPGWAALHD